MRRQRKPRPTYSRYAFTSFDVQRPLVPPDAILALDKMKILFCVLGYEDCPSTGKLHVQGYIELITPCRPRKLQRQLPNFHVEPAKAGREANVRYCIKSGLYTVIDQFSQMRHISGVPASSLNKEGGGQGGDDSTNIGREAYINSSVITKENYDALIDKILPLVDSDEEWEQVKVYYATGEYEGENADIKNLIDSYEKDCL